MHRRPLLSLLERYALDRPEEAGVSERFRTFVEAHPDCFERSLAPGHLTGSAWILDRSGGRVLLCHHRKLGIWLQPGGHADGDPDLCAVAMREAIEETGLARLEFSTRKIFDLDIHTIPARRNEPEHLHYDVRFLLRDGSDGRYRVSEESHDLAWVPLGDLESISSEPSLLRMRDKCLSSSRIAKAPRP